MSKCVLHLLKMDFRFYVTFFCILQQNSQSLCLVILSESEVSIKFKVWICIFKARILYLICHHKRALRAWQAIEN